MLFLLEKDGTEFELISNSCQVIAHKKLGNVLKKSGDMGDTVHSTKFIQLFTFQ